MKARNKQSGVVTDFNLSNALTDVDTQFKVLVMNQYLNPAAMLSVGGTEYERVKTYGGSAHAVDPNTGSPEEELSTGSEGRQSWRDIINLN